MSNTVKSIRYISNATVRVAPDLLKTLAMKYNCQKICSRSSRLNHTGSQGKGHISWGDQQAYYLSFFTVKIHSSVELPLEGNQKQMPLTNQG